MSTGLRRALAVVTTAVAIPVFVAVPSADAATAAANWAPAATATIHPGTQMFTNGAQCTANFVFSDGLSTYVGYAAHCAGTGEATDTDGCATQSLPLGTPVTFNKGATLVTSGTQVGTGTLAYSSWIAMRQAGETNPDTCAYNDFALVKVDAPYVANVNPSMPFWGGPVALNSQGTTAGQRVFSYGNSIARGGIELLSPKTGVSLGDEGNGWSHTVYTVTPGIPGDSGSGFLDSAGNALGTLSTVQLAPLVGANGVGNLARELAYANAHGMPGVSLVPGTEAFAPIV
jgi:hypothetical protein